MSLEFVNRLNILKRKIKLNVEKIRVFDVDSTYYSTDRICPVCLYNILQ